MSQQPNFQPMGVRRRIKNVWLRKKFERTSRRNLRRRQQEIDALIKKNRA